jgi:GT2 family glycosyltransferase
MATIVGTPQPLQAPDVSVVICAYSNERWAQLGRAVESVWAQTTPPAEVVVAIDHNPALAERARTAFSGAIVVENDGPRGLSGARNAGVAASRGSVVAFLDDDAVAAPDWLERLGASYDGPEVLGVGGMIEADFTDGRPAAFPREFDWVVGCTHPYVPDTVGPVRNMIGANMSLRRDVFDAVGGFTSGIGRVGRLPLGCEETELCIRARRRSPGGQFLFDPAARVAHSVPPARADWSYFRRRCFAEGLSKARVAASTGTGDALSTERAYVARTLPAGVLRGIRDALGGDAAGLARAALIVAGLALTTAGYLVGTLREAAR